MTPLLASLKRSLYGWSWAYIQSQAVAPVLDGWRGSPAHADFDQWELDLLEDGTWRLVHREVTRLGITPKSIAGGTWDTQTTEEAHDAILRAVRQHVPAEAA